MAAGQSVSIRNDLTIYDHAAGSWWTGQTRWVRTLAKMVPARLDFFDRLIDWSGKDVLDLGCAGGFMAEALAKRGADVTGIDPAEQAIAAAKAGVSGLVLSAAASYARSSIRFNAVAPGLVDTPLTERIIGNEKALESSLKLHAVRRAGEADEIASLVEWLVGPSSSWMTGQTLSLDGGLAHIKSN